MKTIKFLLLFVTLSVLPSHFTFASTCKGHEPHADLPQVFKSLCLRLCKNNVDLRKYEWSKNVNPINQEDLASERHRSWAVTLLSDYELGERTKGHGFLSLGIELNCFTGKLESDFMFFDDKNSSLQNIEGTKDIRVSYDPAEAKLRFNLKNLKYDSGMGSPSMLELFKEKENDEVYNYFNQPNSGLVVMDVDYEISLFPKNTLIGNNQYLAVELIRNTVKVTNDSPAAKMISDSDSKAFIGGGAAKRNGRKQIYEGDNLNYYEELEDSPLQQDAEKDIIRTEFELDILPSLFENPGAGKYSLSTAWANRAMPAALAQIGHLNSNSGRSRMAADKCEDYLSN